MVFSFINIPFLRKDPVDIPQRDPDHKDERAAFVEKNRNNYLWTQEAIKGASMIQGLPNGENPALGWIEDLVPILIRVALNTALNQVDESFEDLQFNIVNRITAILGGLITRLTTGAFNNTDASDLFDAIGNLLESNIEGQGETIPEYKELYQNIKLDTVVENDQFFRDDIFGWYRVAGPNPMRLTRLKGQVSEIFPDLTNDVVRGITSFSNDSLEEMARDGRLYTVSYPEFEGVPTGKDQKGNLKPNFVYSPTCLLAVPKSPKARETVLPLAIRCGQDKSKCPMYTANPNYTDSVAWLAAKVTVQVADSVIHETVYHLARTHLLVGIAVCATHRALPSRHPLYRLLKCHFYGTAFINNAALDRLINPGGTIDYITAPDIFVTRGVAAAGINHEDSKFNNWFPDVELSNRDVMDESLKYPYRDDALAVWEATLEWVKSFVGTYYKSDSDVANDYELQAWCREISDSDKGNLHGFGDSNDGKIRSVAYLSRAIALFIFTATTQHAAVNFPQSTLMQFAPSMPLAGYAPAPTEKRPYASIDEFVEAMMPTLNRAEKQLQTAELIGVLKYGTFAEYGRNLEFAPDEVDLALKKLQTQLGVITGNITARNQQELAENLPVYNFLVPANIPQSINV